MRVLALDQATNCGVAVIDADSTFSPPFCSLVYCGVIKSKGEEGIEIFLDFEKRIYELIEIHKPDVVVIEEIHLNRNVDTFKFLAKLQYVVQLVCHKLNLPLFIYMTKVARAMFKLAGPGVVKADITSWAKNMYPSVKSITHDLADALLFGTYHVYKEVNGFEDVHSSRYESVSNDHMETL